MQTGFDADQEWAYVISLILLAALSWGTIYVKSYLPAAARGSHASSRRCDGLCGRAPPYSASQQPHGCEERTCAPAQAVVVGGGEVGGRRGGWDSPHNARGREHALRLKQISGIKSRKHKEMITCMSTTNGNTETDRESIANVSVRAWESPVLCS